MSGFPAISFLCSLYLNPFLKRPLRIISSPLVFLLFILDLNFRTFELKPN